MPLFGGAFRVDVTQDDSEIRVVAELRGVHRENISARLLSPIELAIACEAVRNGPRPGKGGRRCGRSVRPGTRIAWSRSRSR
jgi:hypothetical protein